MAKPPVRDPWQHLAAATPARIALGRTGGSLPTAEVLRFALAHAEARDAVHAPFDSSRLATDLRATGLTVVEIESRASGRAAYLRRPDLGRALPEASRLALDLMGRPGGDLGILVADGLSALATESHAAALIAALRPLLARAGIGLGPVVVARGARVALGDAVGERLGVRSLLVLIGERPGLTSPDSLGAYLTVGPRPGRMDSERNCVSNIRPGGLAVDQAAPRIAWLAAEALRRGLTGIALKDESDRLGGATAADTIP
ncbi:ethanolamine ammonia-lyase subunit EutC [Phreatobacter sp.]|uniref:ethanolamine ammonia-lyase subunit EutC n=1 Tax=Phreatobacter sp. TaxID=1966341 RepID=UPI003F7236CD